MHLNIVLTGGNSGIGLETLKQLYLLGHNIVFGSRNTLKNQQVINIINKLQGGKVKSYQLDLSKTKSIQQFANFVNQEFEYIDILINNSGVVLTQPQISQLNMEMTMTVNHFGHFYLTYLLFDKIKKSKEARIINVSSILHTRASDNILQNIHSVQNHKGFRQYQNSKMANVQFTFALSKKLQNKYPNIKTVSLHPGIVETEIYNTFGYPCLMKLMLCCCCCFFKTPNQGAMTTLHVCNANFKQLRNGQYYDNQRHAQMDQRAQNPKNYLALWEASQKAYGIKFEI